MDPVAFSAVSALTPVAEGRFAGTVSAEWTIADKPNGGYLLGMLGRAAVAATPHPHVLTASACYVRSPEPGPVEIEVDVLRAGRSASQVHARMLQDGQRTVEALLTTSTVPAADTKPYWTAGLPPLWPHGYTDSVRIPGRSPSGFRVAMADHVEVRIDPDTLGFAAGKPTGRGELRGWLALPGDEPFDPLSLVFAVDAFPPGTFDVELSGWAPTLELTVYVRALPVPGPVRVLQRAQSIDGDRFDEACFVWDSAGRLVAQGTQLAGIRLG
jgi:hypothetical protein